MSPGYLILPDSPEFSTEFTMFFPKHSLELDAKIPPWFATKQFPQRSNIPSKMGERWVSKI